MKIIQINNLYKPYQKGGAERIVEMIDGELKAAGHNSLVISTRPLSNIKLEEEAKNFYYLSSSYTELNKHSSLYRLCWQIVNLFNYKKYRLVFDILKKEKPDLVISHNLMGLGLLIPLAIKQSKAKHIHILHDIQLLHPSGLMYFGQENILESYYAKIYQIITRFLFSLSKDKKIISPSKWLLQLHKSHGLFENDKNFVINNPIHHIEVVNRVREKAFCFIGQLEYHKGVDIFIKAASFFPDYEFKIIGDGQMMEEIKKQSAANIKILGRQSSEEVLKTIANSEAVIITSRCYENSPTVIYEAYSVKTPVIAANLGGIPELIDKFGGLLFKPDDLESLIEAITLFTVLKAPLKENDSKINYSQAIMENVL